MGNCCVSSRMSEDDSSLGKPTKSYKSPRRSKVVKPATVSTMGQQQNRGQSARAPLGNGKLTCGATSELSVSPSLSYDRSGKDIINTFAASGSTQLTVLEGMEGDENSDDDGLADSQNGASSTHRYRANFDKKVVAKYEIISLLGRGKFSRIVRAEHIQSKQPYAIKMIDKALGREVCDAELAVLQRVRHNNIIRLIEYFDSSYSDKVYMVLELALGGELFERVVQRGHFSEIQAVRCMEMILDGLRHLHRLGFVHRDLHPENILYYHPGDDSKLLITNFGVSANVRTSPGGRLHDIVGTPAYMAPQVFLKQPYDTQVDMWSAGVIAYVVLFGVFPFEDCSLADLASSIMEMPIDFGDDALRYTSIAGLDFIESLLRIDPHERLTADQALLHPWITRTTLTGAPGSSSSYSSHTGSFLAPTRATIMRRTLSGGSLVQPSGNSVPGGAVVQRAPSVRSMKSTRSTRSLHSTRSQRSDRLRRRISEEIETLSSSTTTGGVHVTARSSVCNQANNVVSTPAPNSVQ